MLTLLREKERKSERGRGCERKERESHVIRPAPGPASEQEAGRREFYSGRPGAWRARRRLCVKSAGGIMAKIINFDVPTVVITTKSIIAIVKTKKRQK